MNQKSRQRTTESITLDDYLNILDNNNRILTSRTELLLHKHIENSYIPAYCAPNLAKQYFGHQTISDNKQSTAYLESPKNTQNTISSNVNNTSTSKKSSTNKKSKRKNKKKKNRNSEMLQQPELEKLSVTAASVLSSSSEATPTTADSSKMSQSTDATHFDSLYESENGLFQEPENSKLKNNTDSMQTLTYVNSTDKFDQFSGDEITDSEKLEIKNGEKDANCTFESGFISHDGQMMSNSVYSNTSCFTNASEDNEMLLGGESVYGDLPLLEQSLHNSIEIDDKSNKNTHYLNTPWTFWQIVKSKYELQQDPSWTPVKIATFHSIEEFWFIISRLKMPSSVAPKADFMVFREGIEPVWEDEANEPGGCWKVILDKKSCKKNKIDRKFIDRIWLETILMVIGEQFYCQEKRSKLTMNESTETFNVSNNINGIYLQRRQKEDRLSLWTAVGSGATIESDNDETALKSIGTTFKDIIKVTTNTPINFSAHEDQNNNKGKSLKYRQVVRFMV